MMYSDKNQQLSNQTTSSSSAVPLEAIDRPQVPVASQEATLQLLEERVVVDRSKRKIGEVIVRKEVETYMVQVPVRRERLIVEQVSPESKQLASIDLAQGELTGIEFSNGTNRRLRAVLPPWKPLAKRWQNLLLTFRIKTSRFALKSACLRVRFHRFIKTGLAASRNRGSALLRAVRESPYGLLARVTEC